MAKLPSFLKHKIRLLDVHSHTGVDPLLYLNHSFPFCHSLRDAFEENTRVGISHAVVFPWVTSLYYHLPSLMKGTVRLGGGIGRAPFHFENEQMLRQLYEIFPSYRRMFIPFVVVDTLRETRAQVRVLEKLLDRYPFYGIKVMPRATQARLATLGREGRCILEFARAHDLPFMLHTAVMPLDRLSRIEDFFHLARTHPRLRFCAAHFCGFHRKTLEEADGLDNVWVDAAALTIGCELVRQKAPVYAWDREKVSSNYRDPAQVFAALARRYPDTLVWGTDNPAHTWVEVVRLPSGRKQRYQLWSSMEREVALLRRIRGPLRRKVSVANALRLIEG